MKHFYLFILVLSILSQQATAQTACNNVDFSAGNFSNWQGQWNNVPPNGGGGGNGAYGALTVSGFNSTPTGYNDMGYVHEFCNGGVDRNVPISRVAPGHTYSVRLGDDSAYIQNINVSNKYPYNHQTLSTTFSVTVPNQTITYWYAVVLSQSSSAAHPVTGQPYFRISLFDSSHQEITCARYDVNATSSFSIGGFDSLTDVTGSNTFIYKDWTPVTVSLSQYYGQKLTAIFETSDCFAGGHFAYAYITADCGVDTTHSTTCIITNINKQTSNHQVNIYPNPAQNNFTVEVSNSDKQTLSVFDVNGKLVSSQIINGTTSIDAGNLSAGVYCISISSSQFVINKRLVIVR